MGEPVTITPDNQGVTITPDTPESSPEPGFVNTLQREVTSAGQTLLRMPASIYQAFTQPATPEEKQQSKGLENFPGALGISRLVAAPVANAIDYYRNYAKSSPDQKIMSQSDMLNVAPEAMGQSAANVIAPKLAELGLDAAPYARPVGEALVKASMRKFIPREVSQAINKVRLAQSTPAPEPSPVVMPKDVPPTSGGPQSLTRPVGSWANDLQPLERPSSRLTHQSYNPEEQVATFRYPNGQATEFHGISPQNWADYQNSPSLGQGFEQHIINKASASRPIPRMSAGQKAVQALKRR